MRNKNVSRRQFLYMASSTAAAALLASCAPAAKPAVQGEGAPKEAAAPKQPVKLRWWGGVPEPNGPQQTVEAWNAANSDIQVEYVQYPNNDEGNVKLDTALMVGGEVDVVVSYGLTRLKQRADAGALEPLDAYLSGFDPEKEFGKLDNRWDGKYWALILNMQPFMIFINKQAFEEAGIAVPTDWSWDELMDAARKTTKGEGASKRYGIFLNGEWGLDPALYDKGGDFIYKDKCTTNYDDPLFNWALNLRKSMQDTDKSAMPYGDILAAKLTPFGEFLAGNTAMLLEGSWILRYVKNTAEYPRDFLTTMAPIPHPSSGPNGFRPGTADDRASIAAKSNHKPEAYQFLKWWGTEGYLHMTPFGRTTLWKGRTPKESSEAFTSDFADKEKYLDVEAYERVMYGNMEKNFPIPTRSEAAAEIGTIQREEIGKVLLGESTVEKGLAEIKRRADDALGKDCS